MIEILRKNMPLIEPNGTVKEIHPVSGGSINEAYYVRSEKCEYFVKINRKQNKHFFEIEAEGLELIYATDTISIPKVYGVLEDEDTNIPMLWLEYVKGKRNNKTETLLGEQLAALHLSEGDGYGFRKDTYIGFLPQENGMFSNWIEYYREQRLGGQLRLGRKLGTISGEREKRLVALMERLDSWLPSQPKRSLLHGDLWGGNWITGKEGLPYLIDPSVLYGDHEFELAFTEVFGGFSRSFYEAYQGVFPLSANFDERKEIYQLYYLLVHLNMFGESYGSSVDRILKRYIS